MARDIEAMDWAGFEAAMEQSMEALDTLDLEGIDAEIERAMEEVERALEHLEEELDRAFEEQRENRGAAEDDSR